MQRIIYTCDLCRSNYETKKEVEYSIKTFGGEEVDVKEVCSGCIEDVKDYLLSLKK